jgi:hypothetical protein
MKIRTVFLLLVFLPILFSSSGQKEKATEVSKSIVKNLNFFIHY